MAGLNDLIRSSGGSGIAKPLMLGLGALLATNVLFGGRGQTASASAHRQRTLAMPVEYSADWAGC